SRRSATTGSRRPRRARPTNGPSTAGAAAGSRPAASTSRATPRTSSTSGPRSSTSRAGPRCRSWSWPRRSPASRTEAAVRAAPGWFSAARSGRETGVLSRAVAASTWAFLAWLLLTWTRTAEQLLFGAGLAVLTGLVCATLGPVAPPWALLRPARLAAVVRLVAFAAVEIVRANLSLSRRIWTPGRPLRPGMVIVPTELDGDGGQTAVALITSLI